MPVLNIIEIFANILDAYYPLLYGGEPNFEWSLAIDAWAETLDYSFSYQIIFIRDN